MDISEVNQPPELPTARNAKYLEDGRIDCEIEHAQYGWIPTTVSRDENAELFDHVKGSVDVVEFLPPAHSVQRDAALVRVNQAHADFLRQLTGDATIEERDTWKTKEEAARALIAGAASHGQTAMIGYEAAGAGVEPDVLAQTIVAKAEAFQALIGKAAGLRAQAKAAIARATDESVPLGHVGAGVAAVFEQFAEQATAAVSEWHTSTGQ